MRGLFTHFAGIVKEKMSVIRKLFKYDISSVLIPSIILAVLLMITSEGFLSSYNMHSLFQTVAIYVLIGLAQMSVLSLGQFNLAVGSIGCLSGVCMGFFMQVLAMPVPLAITLGIAVAALLGGVQGVLIAKSGINPFIITLALLSVFKGIAIVITKGEAFSQLPDAFKEMNRIQFGPVPLSLLIAVAVCFIVFWIFRFTKLGRRLEACGANPRAAKFSGINVTKTIISGHMLSGILCGVAAMIQVAKFGSAQLSVGDDWMLTSFVVAVLGGTLLSGGKVSVVGTLVGSFLMVLINNALVIWGVNTYAFQIFLGVVLLAAFEVDRARVNMLKKQSDVKNLKVGEDKNE